MSQQKPIQVMSLIAGADLSVAANRFKVVILDSTSRQVVLSGANGEVYGVLQNLPESGQTAEVVRRGTAKVVAGAAIAYRAQVKADAAGKAITGGGGSDKNFGIALEAAAADGDIIEIDLFNVIRVT
jgi:hypothetical protein